MSNLKFFAAVLSLSLTATTALAAPASRSVAQMGELLGVSLHYLF